LQLHPQISPLYYNQPIFDNNANLFIYYISVGYFINVIIIIIIECYLFAFVVEGCLKWLDISKICVMLKGNWIIIAISGVNINMIIVWSISMSCGYFE
jgi:hypothetical protein